jgi:hypothetical protein
MMGEMITSRAVPLLLLWQAPSTVPTTGLTQDQQFQIAREAVRYGGHRGLEEIVVPIAVFTMLVLLAWLKLRQRQAQIQTATELRRQLLDKFASGRELSDFLESKSGQQFLIPLPSVSRGGWQRGLIATMLGLALLGLALKGQGHYLVVGVLLVTLGVALLISALISHRLAIKNASTAGNGRDQITPRQL